MKTLLFTIIVIASATAFSYNENSQKDKKRQTCVYAGVRYPIGSFVKNSPNTIQECTLKSGKPFWKEPIKLPK